jgi:hypothetical protein
MNPLERTKQSLFQRLSECCPFMENWVKADQSPAQTRLLIGTNQLEAPLSLAEDELPMVELYLDKNDFVVLTTRSIYIRRQHLFLNRTYTELRRQQGTFNKQQSRSKQTFFQELKNRTEQTLFFDYPLCLDDGNVYLLRVEHGTPYFLGCTMLNFMYTYMVDYQEPSVKEALPRTHPRTLKRFED